MTATGLSVNSLLRNPVSYSIFAFVLLFVVISFGESWALVAQHILIPYTVDVSRGIGDKAASVFRFVALIAQCLVGLFVFAASRAESRSKRLGYSVFGILFVVVYFMIVAVGYVTPRLH